MNLIARKRALALVLLTACTPGEPQTTDPSTTHDSTTNPTTDSTTHDSTTTNPTTDSTTHDPTTTTNPTTDTTTTAEPTSEPSTTETTTAETTCADLCQQILDCRVPTTLEQCTADCDSADPDLQACTLACAAQPTCDDLLHCTTLCNHPGDPDATPYADCAVDASHCQPGVYMCLHTKHGDDEFSVCAPFCDEDDPCPTPATGDAKPVCDVNSDPPTCSLDCSDGQQCPDDMTCDIQSGICAWPVP